MNQEQELIRRAQNGDMHAFEQIVFAYQQRIVAVALRYVGNREDALDVAQEVFIRLYRFLPQYDRHQRFFTWLYRIVCNVCNDQFRRSQRTVTAVPLAAVAPDQLPEAAPTDLQPRELGDTINRLIGQLSGPQRLVFTLREMEGLTCREIAETMELPAGTVRSHLHHARKKLQDLLVRHYPELIEDLIDEMPER